MTSDLEHLTVKSTLYTLNACIQGPNFGAFCSTSCFKTPSVWKLEMHQMTSDWPWAFKCQKYLVYTEQLSLKPKILSVSLYDQTFPRHKVAKNLKCTKWPWTLNLKSTLHTLNTCLNAQIWVRFTLYIHPAIFPVYIEHLPLRSNFWSILLYNHNFWDTMLLKIRMHRMISDWPWTLNCQKVPCIPWILACNARICVCFILCI